jgi:hypothetical protein
LAAPHARDVFINCPFDEAYREGLVAIVFAVIASGFTPRCALEVMDSSQNRLEKIYALIEQCPFGVHDLSRTEVDPQSQLPRFNMPLELGIFLGAKRFGGDGQAKKKAIVLDTEKFRYRTFISDLSGIDPEAHAGSPREIVRILRNWLQSGAKRLRMPSEAKLLSSFDRFVAALPMLADDAGQPANGLGFPELERLIVAWVKEERRLGQLT